MTDLLPRGRTVSDVADLLAQVAAGDRNAFAALYDATSLKLFGILLRILHRRDRAEDLLQEVYLRIWERAGSFDRERASPITWMATIARNRAIDEVRRHQLSIVGGDDDLPEIPDETPGALEAMEQSEDARQLEACLDGLVADRADMVRQAYLNGMSRQELADRYGQPVNTIKTWLRRSLVQLRECLGS